MRVYMRVGGDYGCCGGVQVERQVREVNALILFLNNEPLYKRQLAALNHPIKRICHVLGADRSQTHFSAKPDGIVFKNFRKGTRTRNTKSEKTAAQFVIPHDVVLKEGDINTTSPVVEEDYETDDDSDDDTPISELLRRETELPPEDSDDNEDVSDIPDPPLGKEAVGVEVACDFGEPHGVCFGAITEQGVDEGDPFYQVTYDDGDFADFDEEEYNFAYELAWTITRGRKGKKKKPKPKKKPLKKKIKPAVKKLPAPPPSTYKVTTHPHSR
jgi:hypothetical protein